MTRAELQDAIQARLSAAYQATLAVDPDFDFQLGNANRRSWTVDADQKVFRGYYRRAGTERLSDMDHTLDRTKGLVVIHLLTPAETGEDVVDAIFEAIRPHFLTNGDGLNFEEPLDDQGGRREGAHWLTAVQVPFFADSIRN